MRREMFTKGVDMNAKTAIKAIVLAVLIVPATVNATLYYSPAVLADTQTLYYQLDEPSEPTAVDSSTGAHNGTYTGGYTLGQAGALTGGNYNDTAVKFTASGTGYINSTFVLNPTSAF